MHCVRKYPILSPWFLWDTMGLFLSVTQPASWAVTQVLPTKVPPVSTSGGNEGHFQVHNEGLLGGIKQAHEHTQGQCPSGQQNLHKRVRNFDSSLAF